jgi:hypothetical protein
MLGVLVGSMRPTSQLSDFLPESNEYLPCVGVSDMFSTVLGISTCMVTFSTILPRPGRGLIETSKRPFEPSRN